MSSTKELFLVLVLVIRSDGVTNLYVKSILSDHYWVQCTAESNPNENRFQALKLNPAIHKSSIHYWTEFMTKDLPNLSVNWDKLFCKLHSFPVFRGRVDLMFIAWNA
jgi:hypothetical protein